MSIIRVSQEKCTLCGMCVLECPAGIFTKGEVITTVEDAEIKCIKCGHCMSICPVEAITLPSVQPGQLVPIDKKLNVNKEQIGQFLKSNRSMRQYKDTEVKEEVIAELMDITRYAPSARNIEPLHWIITKTRKETRYLADLTAQGMTGLDRYGKMAEFHTAENDIVFRGAPHVIIAHANSEGFIPYVDCTIGITYFDLAANSFGMGTCWAGIFMLVSDKYSPIADYLKLPEGHKVYGAMMFGYPKYEYKRIPRRHQAKVKFI